ncbi:recombination mediator RecR [Legionella sp. W05-934-2]|uniref:recombination mediator RecR n=1 Tax=Legionella sp. W05-934-2 TaxID=1198649 RepID=UPI0034637081
MTLVEQLADALRCLPGVGPKSAQRMVFHLLRTNRQRGLHLATCLEKAMNGVHACQQCRFFAEQAICPICADEKRDPATLCVVESPVDVMAIEQSHVFKGTYFVLNGKISPLDGLGPEDIGLPELYNRVQSGAIKEVILAISPSIEGQTTIYHIQQMLKPLDIVLSQLAQGIPSGGELEFLDGYTISRALQHRAALQHD